MFAGPLSTKDLRDENGFILPGLVAKQDYRFVVIPHLGCVTQLFDDCTLLLGGCPPLCTGYSTNYMARTKRNPSAAMLWICIR